jgi:thiamine biosynthesis lipoprotein
MNLTPVNNAARGRFDMLDHRMKSAASTLVLLTCLLTAAACQRAPRVYQAQLFVFGTVVDVSIQGVDEETADRAFRELQQDFQAMHRDWHAWEPGLLTGINEEFAAGRPVVADAGIVEMVRRSQQIEAASGGRFNPAIGALVRLWGFHTSDYPIEGPPPSAEAIRALVDQRPSTLDIRIDELTLSSDNPAVQLDFGGIAKGYAIDLACNRLRTFGIQDAIVNAGGDLRAIGDHGDRPWRVAIRNPGGGVIGSLETRPDEAIFTSGNYERFRLDAAQRYPHILDPRTGWPVRGLSSATVIAPEGLVADAAATVLVVAGPDDWAEVARSLGLEQVLLVDDSGMVYMTPAMSERIELIEGIEAVVSDRGRPQP